MTSLGCARKSAPEDEHQDQPSRIAQAQQVAEEYASDQREIIKKLRKPLN
ncbi:hypothetical protein KIP88_34845 [Bradyrhizobium sp. SRL28]|nr:hypothetical protein [Bradyrhizobium sp. SRL28]MBT1515660.1 hypothetical protein [Bradyrhizobium sp. SRL28]